MWIAELWRYPVKSMAGERLHSVELTRDGLRGDRLVYVQDDRGHIITSRTHPRLLGHKGTLGPEGEPLVDARPWNSDEVAREVIAAAGPKARLVHVDGAPQFDILPLLVATDGAIQAFGHDGRRLRPNLVIGGVEGLSEREWEGKTLRAGPTVIGIRDLRSRCVMTTIHPDTLVQDVQILKRIQRDFGGRLALNCFVVTGGLLRVGDLVVLQ